MPKLLADFTRAQNARTVFVFGGEKDINLFSSAFPGTSEKLQRNILFSLDNAKSINVNLDGVVKSVDDLPGVIELGNKGIDFERVVNGRVFGNTTNFEISTILQNQSLRGKTQFFLGGEPVEVP